MEVGAIVTVIVVVHALDTTVTGRVVVVEAPLRHNENHTSKKTAIIVKFAYG